MNMIAGIGAVRATAYSHRVRKKLKTNHGIWLTGLQINGNEMQTFLEFCFHCWQYSSSSDRCAQRYADACHRLGRHPTNFDEATAQ